VNTNLPQKVTVTDTVCRSTVLGRALKRHAVFGPVNLSRFCERRFRWEHNAKAGVYLWTVALPDGAHKVWYVGQTIGSFRSRIRSEIWPEYFGRDQLDLDEYVQGRQVFLCGTAPTREYVGKLCERTELLLIPMEPEDSPLLASGPRRSLFKPAESAVLRQLCKDAELERFLWNRSEFGRGVELREPRYPCFLDCPVLIRGLEGRIDG
jgi:hypothetical protein